MAQNAESTTASGNVSGLLRPFASPGKFLLLIAIYFVWQIVLRLITSNSAELDESEQLFLTQQLAWGYGPQPPLYTWLQFPFIQQLGPSILALAVFKNALLFCIYALTYWSARLLTRNHWLAVTATVSLLFVPQISWESQRDLTHSVLVTLAAAATFFVFLRLRQARRLRFYLILGLCIGFGVLAKYSYVLFLVGLILAALSLPSLRSIIYDRRMLLALALGAIIVTPHLVWAKHHKDAVLAASGKFQIKTDQPWIRTTAAGARNLAGAIGAHAGALLGVYLILCWKRTTEPLAGVVDRDGVRLIGRSLAIIFAILVVAIVGFKVTNFKDRWLLPVCICLPLLLVGTLPARLSLARLKWMIGIGAVVIVVVSFFLPGRIWMAEKLNKPDQPNAPFDKLSAEIHRLYPGPALLISENFWIGGNLRLFLPQSTVWTQRVPLRPPLGKGDECLVVWDATQDAQPPEKLISFAGRFAELDVDANQLSYVEAPLKFFQTRNMRLGLMRGKLKPTAGLSVSAKALE
jgi:lipopolysaccharide core galacturonosyltransferase RgtB